MKRYLYRLRLDGEPDRRYGADFSRFSRVRIVDFEQARKRAAAYQPDESVRLRLRAGIAEFRAMLERASKR